VTRRLLAVTLVCVLVLASAPLPVAAHLNHVTAGTQQTPDGTVIVESSFASNDGYLTVQRDDGGEPGEVVGVTSIRSQRYRIDVGVTIDESAWAKWETQPVHIVLRRDDGDGEFDPDEDPVVESFGSAATERLTVAKGPRAVVTASETLRPDAEGTVTVRRVTLPETGNLVVHTPRDRQSGRPERHDRPDARNDGTRRWNPRIGDARRERDGPGRRSRAVDRRRRGRVADARGRAPD